MIIQLANCEVHLLDSPKHLSAERHKDFQNHLAQEHSIGSDVSDIKKRAEEVINYMDSDQKSAKAAATNIYFTIQSIVDRINHNSRAFAVLVDKIVYKSRTVKPNYSDEGLDALIKLLSDEGLTQEKVDSNVSEVKKKLNEN